jgi:signal transduction histidine kinase
MIRRVISVAWRYVPGTAIFALLVWSTGPMRRWGLAFDPTFLIILTMIGTAWYLGRGPGLLLALLFEGTLDYFAAVPISSARQAVVVFNRILLFTSIVFFASARRAAEQKLRQQQEALEATLTRERDAREEAERATRLKDEFLANVSHELRTPLNALLGWAAILRTHDVDRETTRKAAEVIERNARAQAQIVEDLLDMSSISTGALRVAKEPLDVAPVVEGAIESLRLAAAAKQIQIAFSTSGNALIVGDAGRIQQIAWNLIGNAIKFSRPGGSVQVALRCDGGWAELIVRDNGIGIAPEFLPRVFDRFRQADGSLTREQGGLGLGLAIVRQLSELQGGTVSAASDGPGKGSTFTVRLPLAPDLVAT